MPVAVETWMGEDLELGTDDTSKTHPSGGVLPGTQISLTTFSLAGADGHATTATWEPGEIAIGAVASTTVTVQGAQVGDKVVWSHDALGADALIKSEHVSAANTVTLVLANLTASAVTVASGTVSVLVFRVR